MEGFTVFNLGLIGSEFQSGKRYKGHNSKTEQGHFIGNIDLSEPGFIFWKTFDEAFGCYRMFRNCKFYKIKAVGKITECENNCISDEIEILEEIVITPELLNELVHSSSWRVRYEVVNMNPGLEILKLLAKDEAEDVREAVARNPKTDPETLKFLAKDKDLNVREEVAGNLNTDSETLRFLAKDEHQIPSECPHWLVYWSVAKNPNANVETLMFLITEADKDKDWRMHISIAENPNANAEVLKILSKNKDQRVRKAVAKNENTDFDTLKTLANDKSWKVRLAVAKNPNTDPEILKILAQDEDYDIREAVAENPNTDPETLKKLAEDEDEDVRYAAVKVAKKLKIKLK